MRYCIHIVLLLNICALRAQGQVDSILALPEPLQIRAFWNVYFPDWTRDSIWHVSRYQSIQQELSGKGYRDLAKQAWLLETYYQTIGLHRYTETGNQGMLAAIAEAEEKGWHGIVAECLVYRGSMLFDQQKYGPAFESMLRGYAGLKAQGFEAHPFTMRHLSAIAEAYYRFGDYESAIRFAKEALSFNYPWNEQTFTRHLMNTLGLCFQRLNQFDSAMFYFNRTYEASMAVQDSAWSALSLGNLGYAHFLNGDYDTAIPMLEFDFTTSDRLGQYHSAINAALALAEIFLLKGNATAAEPYILYTTLHVDRNDVRIMSNFYKNRYTISKLRGETDKAVAYVDSFLYYQDSLHRVNDARILNQAKLKIEVEQHANEINMLQAKRDREILLRNGVLVFLLMTGIISVLWYSQQSLKRRKEYELSLLQKQMAEEELTAAKRELHSFTKTLKEKNTLIESFQSELEALQQEGVQQSNARTAHINQLINSTLLTDDDWREFRLCFDKVYPGFLVRLKEKLPDLNPAEIRLITLTKLQLAPKEMAAMLGIGYEAIKKSRQRLRKKLNLPEEGTLDELVEMI